MQCIIDSANQTIKRLNVAVDERVNMKVKLQYNGKFSGELTAICDFLEKKPIFMINELVDEFHVSYNTASNRVDMLVKMNIIKKEKEQHRNRIFVAQKYIDIFMESK